MSLTTPEYGFNYTFVNNRTNLKLSADTSVTVSFDFRDFKYLTNIEKFQTVISDPAVIGGEKDASINIDLSKMTSSDKKHGSRFQNGGRMYFEASVFSDSFISFSTNAFIDQEGYSEPVREDKKW